VLATGRLSSEAHPKTKGEKSRTKAKRLRVADKKKHASKKTRCGRDNPLNPRLKAGNLKPEYRPGHGGDISR